MEKYKKNPYIIIICSRS